MGIYILYSCTMYYTDATLSTISYGTLFLDTICVHMTWLFDTPLLVFSLVKRVIPPPTVGLELNRSI